MPAEETANHGQALSLVLNLPPLVVLMLKPET
jgi:1,4-alpha-glucan branching enzyme